MVALNKIIAECGLICPYDDDFISHLDNTCENFLESNDIGESIFTEWVLCYINGTYSPKIKKFIVDYAIAHELGEMELPDCVWSALTFYFIYALIMDNDSEEEKAIYSCSLQNMLLSCKGCWETLSFQDYLLDLYGAMDIYLNKNEEGKDDVSMSFVSSLFETSESSLELDDDNLDNLKSMGKYTWLYKLEHFCDEMNSVEGRNPFLRILYFLDFWYNENPSIYVKVDVKQLMNMAKIDKYKSKKSLREIISSLDSTKKVFFECPASKSSLIIRMINEHKVESARFVEEKLTCAEFFVYLYYELLLELKLKDNDGE